MADRQTIISKRFQTFVVCTLNPFFKWRQFWNVGRSMRNREGVKSICLALRSVLFCSELSFPFALLLPTCSCVQFWIKSELLTTLARYFSTRFYPFIYHVNLHNTRITYRLDSFSIHHSSTLFPPPVHRTFSPFLTIFCRYWHLIPCTIHFYPVVFSASCTCFSGFCFPTIFCGSYQFAALSLRQICSFFLSTLLNLM